MNLASPADPGLHSLFVEVDVSRLQAGSARRELTLRVTVPGDHAKHERGFRYRSLVAVVSLDCRTHRIDPLAATYFASPRGAGPEVGTDSSSSVSGIRADIVDGLPGHVRDALVKAACTGP